MRLLHSREKHPFANASPMERDLKQLAYIRFLHSRFSLQVIFNMNTFTFETASKKVKISLTILF